MSNSNRPNFASYDKNKYCFGFLKQNDVLKFEHGYFQRNPQSTNVWCILEPNRAALVAAVFLLIFLRTNVIFCTKQAWYRTTGPIPRRAAPYEEFPPWGSRHHCPMEIGAYSSLCIWPLKKCPFALGRIRAQFYTRFLESTSQTIFRSVQPF